MRVIIFLAMSLAANAAWASTTVTFTHTGFAGGGTVTGTFTGTDLNNDGQLYAASMFASDVFGIPFGNELEYAEVTLTGFNTATPTTLVYDASVADMTAFSNAFMAFSYNLDGGQFGDDPDEGWSFAFFAPSTNYLLGSAFSFLFNPVPISNPTFGSCGSGSVCGGVVQFGPNPADPSGVDILYASYTSDMVSSTVVPLPAAAWLFLSALGVLGAASRRRG